LAFAGHFLTQLLDGLLLPRNLFIDLCDLALCHNQLSGPICHPRISNFLWLHDPGCRRAAGDS
jgi:hypothetical protein